MIRFLLILLIIITGSCDYNIGQKKIDKSNSSSIFSDEDVNIPNNKAKLLYEESIKFGKNQEFEKELSLLIKADSICPNNPSILTNIGTGYAIAGNSEKALICYDKVIRINPKYSKVYVNYSKVLNSLKKFDEALKKENIGLSIDSIPPLNRKMLFINLAGSYYGLKNYEMALDALKKAKNCSNLDYKKDYIIEFENQIRTIMNK